MNTAPENMRRVADSNRNLKNLIPKNEFLEIVDSTLTTVIDILSAHCGPYGKYAMLPKQNECGSENVFIFTKDGINILSHVEFMNLVETHILTQIQYVGRGVDGKAGDGTTSSMIFASKFIQSLLKGLQDVGKFTALEISQNFTEFVAQVQKNIEDHYSFTVEKLKELHPEYSTKHIRQAVALIQSLSSSHGDYQLSKLVSDLVGEVPENLLSQIYIHELGHETKELYWIEKRDCCYQHHASIHNPSWRNHNANTEYKEDDVVLMVAPDTISDNSPLLDYVTMWCKDHSDKTLVVVTSKTGGTFERMVGDIRFKNVRLFRYTNKTFVEGMDADLHSLSVVAGKYPIYEHRITTYEEFEDHLIHGVSIHYKDNGLMSYDGLFEKTEYGVHPYMSDLDNAPLCYREWLDQVVKTVERIRESKIQETRQKTLDELQAIHIKLVMPGMPAFVIGGAAYTGISARDVVRDCLAATMASLDSGFALGSMFTLARGLSMCPEPKNKIIDVLESACYDGVWAVWNALFKEQIDKDKVVDNADLYFNLLSPGDGFVSFNDTFRKFLDMIADEEKLIECETAFPIIQPNDVYEQLFLRIQDLLLNLCSVEHVITRNTVYLGKSQSAEQQS